MKQEEKIIEVRMTEKEYFDYISIRDRPIDAYLFVRVNSLSQWMVATFLSESEGNKVLQETVLKQDEKIKELNDKLFKYEIKKLRTPFGWWK